MRNASFAIGRNAEAIENLRRKGYRGKADVVPNGVDTDLFRPMDRCACQQKFGFEGFIIGYAGRMVPEKGLMDLIEALPQCAPDVQVAFIGDGDFKPNLARRAEELGLGGRVHWLKQVAPQELPEIMNALDVLALPSHTTPRWKEQFGRVLVEAMACGIPVIGSTSGAIPEVIGGAGLVFQEGNVSELSKAIATLRDHPEIAASFGKAGRNRVLEWSSWEQVAERMAGIYREVGCERNAEMLKC